MIRWDFDFNFDSIIRISDRDSNSGELKQFQNSYSNSRIAIAIPE
jgi:hypothetical protein